MTVAGLAAAVTASVDALGPEWDRLFAGAGLQSSRAWFGASEAAAIPAGAMPRYVAVAGPGGAAGLFPMLEPPGAAWMSLTTPYTCLYQPLLDAARDPGPACRVFGRLCRERPVTRFEALDPEWPFLPALIAGLGAAGLAVRTFQHFVNWHADIPDRGWPAYLAGRPGALRETIRRKSRAVEREGGRIEIVREQAGLRAALEAYEAVYRLSWKEPEPFPAFNQALVDRLAGTGVLRIALLWHRDVPIAAQYWTVSRGQATVLKLAHDERAKALSPGTVLTAAAIRDLIERDGARVLDFGRGDDGYKRGWTGTQRPRIGVLALNPRRVAGLVPLLRHDAGLALRALRRNLAPINVFLRKSGDTDASPRQSAA